MKALKIILIIIVILAAVIGIMGAIAPNEYHVERSITIEAPAALVHDQVKSLKNRQEWSPWAELDPNQKVAYEGTDGEVGSIIKWEGNEDVGKGMQEVTAISDSRVETKLTFIEPWESESNEFVQLEPSVQSVDVTWGFDGSNPFPFNIMGLFMNMDAMIGKEFEKGLAKLKSRSEQLAAESTSYSSAYEIVETQWPATYFIVKREEVAFDQIGSFFRSQMPSLGEAIGKSGINMAGAACGLYYSWDEDNRVTDMAVAVPVAEGTMAPNGFDAVGVGPSKALMVAYYGAYEKSDNAHYALNDYMGARGDSLNQLVIEEYVTDPATEPDTGKWLTNIYYLIK